MNTPNLLIPIRFVHGQIPWHSSVIRINTSISDYNALVNAIYTCWNQAVFFYPLLDLAEIAGDGSPTACIGLTQWDQSPLQMPTHPFNTTEILQHLNSAEQQGAARWLRVQVRDPWDPAILPPAFEMQDDGDGSSDDDDGQDEDSGNEEDDENNGDKKEDESEHDVGDDEDSAEYQNNKEGDDDATSLHPDKSTDSRGSMNKLNEYDDRKGARPDNPIVIDQMHALAYRLDALRLNQACPRTLQGFTREGTSIIASRSTLDMVQRFASHRKWLHAELRRSDASWRSEAEAPRFSGNESGRQ